MSTLALTLTDGCALAAAYRDGTTDPVTVADQCLAQAARLPGTFITLTPTRARSEAEASRQRWQQGRPLSPLDGVPIAWKDLYDVYGTPTTAGAEIYRNAPPAAHDAPVVEAASRAGLVMIGKTNLSEFAFSGLGLNPHYGTPTNPTMSSVPRVPGGSSSGSAIAVAGGAAMIGMGTDTAGSVRVPAAFNGIVGYRASSGRYPMQAVAELSRTLDSLGPLTRSVRDAVALDAVLSGHPSQEPMPPLPASRLHFVVDEGTLTDAAVEASVRSNMSTVITKLREAGVTLEVRRCNVFHQVLDLIQAYGWLGSIEAFALHEPVLNSADAERLDQRVRRRLESSRALPASAAVRLYQARAELIAQAAHELDGALLLTPTVAHVAPQLQPLEDDPDLFARTNLATLRLTMPGSFLDMPGLALPSGANEHGLSTGVLVSAPSGQDRHLLRASLTVEAILR